MYQFITGKRQKSYNVQSQISDQNINLKFHDQEGQKIVNVSFYGSLRVFFANTFSRRSRANGYRF